MGEVKHKFNIGDVVISKNGVGKIKDIYFNPSGYYYLIEHLFIKNIAHFREDELAKYR